MERKRLFWQFVTPLLALTTLCFGVAYWSAPDSISAPVRTILEQDLRAEAFLLAQSLPEDHTPTSLEKVSMLFDAVQEQSGTVAAYVYPGGMIGTLPESRETICSLTPVAGAFVGREATFVRELDSGGASLLLAWPMDRSHTSRRVLVIGRSIAIANQHALYTKSRILYAWAVTVIVILLVSLWMVRRVMEPLLEMQHGAQRFARGELTKKIPAGDFVEFDDLVQAMNQMAIQLDIQIREIVQQRNEQTAVLLSMQEGVLAVDRDERVITMNRRAIELFHVQTPTPQGRAIQEVVRNSDLHAMIQDALSLPQADEGEIVLYEDDQPQYIQTNSMVLKDGTGKNMGVLLVLNDITQLRRLENVRRDFVANVSHELRTPITSIKGFAETILDGADAADRERFLHTIVRQANRLNNIISDLLSLSAIEQDAGARGLKLRRGSMESVVRSALQACAMAARDKQIEMQDDGLRPVSCAMNAALLEQAVINFIDNAIKYSPAGATVSVRTRVSDTNVQLEVTDTGPGIAKEHHARLFERFYRVDKARSRKMGGTGLGLAITKHIVRAHGGEVGVRSEVGVGSTFFLRIPNR